VAWAEGLGGPVVHMSLREGRRGVQKKVVSTKTGGKGSFRIAEGSERRRELTGMPGRGRMRMVGKALPAGTKHVLIERALFRDFLTRDQRDVLVQEGVKPPVDRWLYTTSSDSVTLKGVTKTGPNTERLFHRRNGRGQNEERGKKERIKRRGKREEKACPRGSLEKGVPKTGRNRGRPAGRGAESTNKNNGGREL